MGLGVLTSEEEWGQWRSGPRAREDPLCCCTGGCGAWQRPPNPSTAGRIWPWDSLAEVTGLPGVPEDTLPSTPFRRPEGVLSCSAIPPLPTSPRLPLRTHIPYCVRRLRPASLSLCSRYPSGKRPRQGLTAPACHVSDGGRETGVRASSASPAPAGCPPRPQPRSAAQRGGGGGW